MSQQPVEIYQHPEQKDELDRQNSVVKEAYHEPLAQVLATDGLSVRQAAWAYRKIGLFCFLAAFTASLDGYQAQLNGSIVANKGESFQVPISLTLQASFVNSARVHKPFCLPNGSQDGVVATPLLSSSPRLAWFSSTTSLVVVWDCGSLGF